MRCDIFSESFDGLCAADPGKHADGGSRDNEENPLIRCGHAVLPAFVTL